MLLIVVLLFHRIVTAGACLQCDRSISTMHEDFILSAPSVEDQIIFQMISDQAYVTYRETSQSRKGVIGETINPEHCKIYLVHLTPLMYLSCVVLANFFLLVWTA